MLLVFEPACRMNTERIELLRKFIREEPTNPFNKYALAMEYYDGQPHESLIMLENLLKNHPDYLPTYYKVAHIYWEMDKWEKAEKAFIDGIKLAEKTLDAKAIHELKAAYLNFTFERD